jgi:hypothetical protein
MRMIGIHSTNLAAAGHDDGVLEVEFLDGGLYRYLGVPRSVFDGLFRAHSAGSYFNQQIKGRFQVERLR